MKKVLLPVFVLLVAAAIGTALFLSRPKPEAAEPAVVPTPVDFLVAEAAPATLRVGTQGTVEPALAATVSAEVGGMVTEVSPNLRRGRFVEEGELLATLEPTDYEAALAEARANLLSAETSLIQAEADAAQAIRDLEEVGVTDPSPLARREPQLRQARLRVDSAEAAVELAEKNLERTRIRAPFTGQVAEAFVDRGDVLPNRGSPVARINGTALAEIRLPLSRADLRHLDLPATPGAISAPPEKNRRCGSVSATAPRRSRLRAGSTAWRGPSIRSPGCGTPLRGSGIRWTPAATAPKPFPSARSPGPKSKAAGSAPPSACRSWPWSETTVSA